jgi:uncharacterized protein with FMN-binding domain
MVKKVLKIVGLVLLAAILVIISGFSAFLFLGKNQTMNLQINDVDLLNVADGTYTGTYNGFRWTNTVEVTVSNHQITDIEVVKPQMVAKAETIGQMKQAVLSQQNLEVDVVSGATIDSKAFLKAVENALHP